MCGGGSDGSGAIDAGIAQNDRFWNEIKGFLNPYQKFGTENLQELEKLLGKGGQDAFLKDYYKSGTYGTQSARASSGLEAAAEASGSLGSSGFFNSLGALGPQLGEQAYENRLNELFKSTGVGENAAESLAGAGGGISRNDSSLYGELAQLQNAQGGGFGSFLGGLGGLLGGLGGLGGGGGIGGILGGLGGLF